MKHHEEGPSSFGPERELEFFDPAPNVGERLLGFVALGKAVGWQSIGIGQGVSKPIGESSNIVPVLRVNWRRS